MRARRIARPMSPAVSAARLGRRRIAEGPLRRLQSLGDDILEGRPREYSEDPVVQRQEQQVALAVRRDRGADPTDHEGDRQREEEQRQQQLARASSDSHRGQERADRADAEIGEDDAREGRTVERREEQHERRKGDGLGGNEEGKGGERLPEPDRAPVAGSENEPVEHAMLLLRYPRPGEPEQRREDDR